jgi:hypothetical protein
MLSVHSQPSDDWMGRTHDYNPIAAFDEFVMQDGWAFGRKGEGYVALTAANGLLQQLQGLWAYRELRSPGLNNVWICQMGRAADNGTFADFVRSVASRPPRFGELSATIHTQRGEELAFAWESPLTVDGDVQPITGFRHYDNLYCQAELPAEEMVIRYQDQQMRLDFALEAQEA